MLYYSRMFLLALPALQTECKYNKDRPFQEIKTVKCMKKLPGFGERFL